MARLRHFGSKVLWAPVGAVVVIGALLAGMMFASAASPSLPKKTPAQLLAAMRHATLPPALTAVISESANLGFPALPDVAGLPSSALSAASWLAGRHTVQIWYSGPQHVRIAVPVSFGETDLRVNGSQVWLWQSQGQVATHIIVAQPGGQAGALWRVSNLRPAQIARIPAFMKRRGSVPLGTGPVFPGSVVHLQAACPTPSGLRAIIKNLGNNGGGLLKIRTYSGLKVAPFRIARPAPVRLHALMKLRALKAAPPGAAFGMLKAITPLQAAQRLLAMLGPTTKVTVAGTTVVAGRPAYQLSIEPRSNQSLIGQILIAVDATSYLPLQVQVMPRGSSSPAFQIGFTTFTPGQPAASNFPFTPPPGAHVHVVKLPNPIGGLIGLGGLPGMFPGQLAPPVMVPKLAAPTMAVPGVRVSVLKLHVAKIIASHPVGLPCLKGWRTGEGPSGRPIVSWTPAPEPAAAGPQVLGSGWLSVVVIPAGHALPGRSGGNGSLVIVKPGAHGSPVPAAGGQAMLVLRTLLNSATRVHGSWGSGRLISTRLVNILITSKGQVLIGAVTPAVLYADAARAQ